MRKTTQISAVVLALVMTSAFAFAQKAEQLTLSPGAKEVVAKGKLESYKSKRLFVIRLQQGQTLSTEQLKSDTSNHDTTVSIKAPNGELVGDEDASCNNRKKISPTVEGNYRIEVYECRKADPWRGTFQLQVKVE